jgi:hypothetical protein
MKVEVGKKYKSKYGVMECIAVKRNRADFKKGSLIYACVPCSVVYIKPCREKDKQ